MILPSPSVPPAAIFDLDFPRCLGAPVNHAGFRVEPEDFVVDEDLGFAADGEGEHLLLQIRKRDQNTRWIAALLAEHFAVSDAAVGYCGLKDRRAVTCQWFSVHLPGKTMPALPELEGAEILAAARHGKKLRPGMHHRNRFAIVLRDLSGARDELDARLAAVARDGVPNYVGEQRFGIDGNNLREVDRIVSHPRPRFRGRRGGLYLSAARSWLFNLVLAERVREGTWRNATVVDGPLWGRGRPSTTPEVAQEELRVLAPWQPWCLALEHSGLRQERRALVLRPEDFRWRWQENDLALWFELAPGCYATSVLRELALLDVPREPAAGGDDAPSSVPG
ncbi:MAG: tRNA pseudouridine(13) synthase TruD [Porticoccaceae bacterium]